MSSLALMRWLENSPKRYDAGMRLLTFGCVAKLHTAVADAAVARAGDDTTSREAYEALADIWHSADPTLPALSEVRLHANMK